MDRHMDECGEQWIEHSECSDYNARGINTERDEKVLPDDAAASPRDLQRLNQTHQHQIVAEQDDMRALVSDLAPEPMVTPTCACASAGASLTPSSTIAKYRPIHQRDHAVDLLV